MNARWPKLVVALVLSGCLTLTARSGSYAAGFGIFTQGAAALGQANAVTAHLDTPSAVFFNPALINDLAGTQIEFGTTLVMPSREFDSDRTGEVYTNDDHAYFPGTMYATRALGDKFSAGLGFFVPFGLGTEWDDDWEGRYIATRSQIQTCTLNPVLSYRLCPKVTVAAGIDFLWLDANLENKVNSNLIAATLGVPAPDLSDGDQAFSGDGTGYGYNFGLLVNLTDRLSLGASYRSEIAVDIDGDLKLSVPVEISPFLQNTGGSADITLPAQVTAGMAYAFTDRLTVEAGVRWEGWSAFDELKIKLDQPVLFQTSQTLEKDWDDTWTYNVGGNYRLNERLSLSAGYLYQQNAVPDETFDPSTPDADCHLFCIGADVHWKRATLGLSYAYQLAEDRDKENAVGLAAADDPTPNANGEYSAGFHLIAASVTIRF